MKQHSKYFIDSNYFSYQLFTKQDRKVVVQWLLDLCQPYKLSFDTFFAAVNYFDRYMTRVANTPKSELLLIAMVCMSIACKVHEEFFFTISLCEHLCKASKKMIRAKEIQILQLLDYRLYPTNPLLYCSRKNRENDQLLKFFQNSLSDSAILCYRLRVLAKEAEKLLFEKKELRLSTIINDIATKG
jgi:hypothetical protein